MIALSLGTFLPHTFAWLVALQNGAPLVVSADTLFHWMEVGACGGVAYTIRELRTFSRQVAKLNTEMAAWRVVLFGPEGGEGMHHQVHDHERRLNHYERRSTPPTRRPSSDGLDS